MQLKRRMRDSRMQFQQMCCVKCASLMWFKTMLFMFSFLAFVTSFIYKMNFLNFLDMFILCGSTLFLSVMAWYNVRRKERNIVKKAYQESSNNSFYKCYSCHRRILNKSNDHHWITPNKAIHYCFARFLWYSHIWRCCDEMLCDNFLPTLELHEVTSFTFIIYKLTVHN